MCSACENVFLTIIVCAYNVEPYVEKCLSSLLDAQLDKKIEVLIVLGNSDDRTNEICERSGFTCVLQDKKGLSNAKNIGIGEARGKYLTFIDADDYIDSIKFKSF